MAVTNPQLAQEISMFMLGAALIILGLAAAYLAQSTSDPGSVAQRTKGLNMAIAAVGILLGSMVVIQTL